MDNYDYWAIEYDGSISQSPEDMKDVSIPLFNETVKAHNKAIEDSKEKPEPEK